MNAKSNIIEMTDVDEADPVDYDLEFQRLV
jgi:hypothetical protein